MAEVRLGLEAGLGVQSALTLTAPPALMPVLALTLALLVILALTLALLVILALTVTLTVTQWFSSQL